MKNFCGTLLALLVISVLLVPTSEASCCGKTFYKDKAHFKKGLEDKFYAASHCVLKKKQELSLSSDQISKIKDLLSTVKKGIIQKNAEMDALSVDIDTLLEETPFNIVPVGELIDKKYELKKEKSHYLLQAYQTLMETLNNEQLPVLEKI